MFPVLIVFTILLWQLANSDRVHHWSPLKGGIIALPLLVCTLLLHYTWCALVIEGWRFRGPLQTEHSVLRPLVDAILLLLQLGRKTGWFFVGISAMICLLQGWRQPSINAWLLKAAAWISTYTCAGVLLELFAPIPAYVFFSSSISAEASATVALLMVFMWLALLGILYFVLIQAGYKQSSPTDHYNRA